MWLKNKNKNPTFIEASLQCYSLWLKQKSPSGLRWMIHKWKVELSTLRILRNLEDGTSATCCTWRTLNYVSSFYFIYFLHVANQFSQQLLLKRLSLFHFMLFAALSKISCSHNWGSILWFSILFHCFEFVLIPVPYCPHYYSFVIQFEVAVSNAF